MATTSAHHIAELDQYLRALRAANAELRNRIESVRAELGAAERERARHVEAARSLGVRILEVEAQVEWARQEAELHLAAVEAAADEEVRRILASARAEAEQLRRALAAVVGSAEPAAVVPLALRAVAPPEQVSTPDDRRVAM